MFLWAYILLYCGGLSRGLAAKLAEAFGAEDLENENKLFNFEPMPSPLSLYCTALVLALRFSFIFEDLALDLLALA